MSQDFKSLPGQCIVGRFCWINEEDEEKVVRYCALSRVNVIVVSRTLSVGSCYCLRDESLTL